MSDFYSLCSLLDIHTIGSIQYLFVSDPPVLYVPGHQELVTSFTIAHE